MQFYQFVESFYGDYQKSIRDQHAFTCISFKKKVSPKAGDHDFQKFDRSTLGKASRKKSSCSFGFCPDYLNTSPSLQFGQLVPLFFNTNVPKNLGRGLPLPPHPPIDPIYTVCEKWKTKLGRALSLLIWTKSKRTATFFGITVPYLVRRT